MYVKFYVMLKLSRHLLPTGHKTTQYQTFAYKEKSHYQFLIETFLGWSRPISSEMQQHKTVCRGNTSIFVITDLYRGAQIPGD